MSYGAKDALIKSVAQSLPSYAMGVFKMSAGFCDQYEKLIRDFWWGDEQNHRKVHWMSWESMIKPKSKGGLGFRDMALFNKALLARKGWRLIQRPTRLCARVLKAKYFPNGNLLDTVFAADASPAWRGIEFDLQLLKKGVIQRIGNGRKTQFIRDNWIPRRSGLKITAVKKNSRRRWVNQLFVPGQKRWDTNLLRDLFHEHDVQSILQIKIPQRDVEDQIAWHYEKSGVFSVKSAYRLGMHLNHRAEDTSNSRQDPSSTRSARDTIWKADIPPKVRFFSWRVATDSLATKRNKWRRTLEIDITCNICGTEEENAFHATVSCLKSVALRHALRKVWTLPPESSLRYTGPNWLLHLLGHLDETTRPKTLLLFWRAWHLRNNIVHDNGKATIADSVIFLQSLWDGMHSTFTPTQYLKGKQPMFLSAANPESLKSELTTWRPPPSGWLKLNTDGSFLPSNNTGGAGAIVRDNKGSVLIASCSRSHNCLDAEEAEARAMLMGIKLLPIRHDTKAIVETDSSSLAAALKCTEQNKSRLWFIIDEAKGLLSKLQGVVVTHTRRHANQVADALAKLAYSAGDVTMQRSFPAKISELVFFGRYGVQPHECISSLSP